MKLAIAAMALGALPLSCGEVNGKRPIEIQTTRIEGPTWRWDRMDCSWGRLMVHTGDADVHLQIVYGPTQWPLDDVYVTPGAMHRVDLSGLAGETVEVFVNNGNVERFDCQSEN